MNKGLDTDWAWEALRAEKWTKNKAVEQFLRKKLFSLPIFYVLPYTNNSSKTARAPAFDESGKFVKPFAEFVIATVFDNTYDEYGRRLAPVPVLMFVLTNTPWSGPAENVTMALQKIPGKWAVHPTIAAIENIVLDAEGMEYGFVCTELNDVGQIPYGATTADFRACLLVDTVVTLSTTSHKLVPQRSEIQAAVLRQKAATRKPPSWEYKTVQITGTIKDKTKVLGGTHASPRQHERRGHWRTYRSGKRVWVKNCVVGDPSLGHVKHAYVVAQGETS